MRNPLARELHDLLERGRDRQLRLAVTGLSRSGKTAFLTSLVNQLRHAGLEARLRSAGFTVTVERRPFHGRPPGEHAHA